MPFVMKFTISEVNPTTNSSDNPIRKTLKMSVNNVPLNVVTTCPCLSLTCVVSANSLMIVPIIINCYLLLLFSFISIIVSGTYNAKHPTKNIKAATDLSPSIKLWCPALHAFTHTNTVNRMMITLCTFFI